jgi:hypothetical protein
MYCKYGDCTGGDGHVFDQTTGYQDFPTYGFEQVKARELTDWLTQPSKFEIDFGYVFSSNSYYDKRTLGFYLNNVDNLSASGADDLRIGGVEYIYRNDGNYIYTFDTIASLYDYDGDYGETLSNPNISWSVVGWYLVRSVPEPSIMALFALGLVGIGFARRRQL